MGKKVGTLKLSLRQNVTPGGRRWNGIDPLWLPNCSWSSNSDFYAVLYGIDSVTKPIVSFIAIGRTLKIEKPRAGYVGIVGIGPHQLQEGLGPSLG